MLTKGSLSSIMNYEEVKNPVMQILGITNITAVGINERYCLIISDGQNYFSYVTMTTQLNNMIFSEKLTEFAIVMIKRYIMSNPRDCPKESKQILFVIDLVLLVSGEIVGLKIGNPIPITDNPGQVIENGSATLVNTSRPQSISLIPHSGYNNVIDNEHQRDVNNINFIDPSELYQEVEHRTVLTIDPRLKHRMIGRYLNKYPFDLNTLNKIIYFNRLKIIKQII